MSIGQTAKPGGKQPLLNRVMSRVLRSPLSRLVDGSVMLLTVYGSRSGRPYTFPVQYVQRGDVLWIYVGRSEEKTWWHNLAREARVQVVLRGRMHRGRGVTYTHDRQPDLVEEGLRQWADRFPRIAKRLGIRPGDAEAFARSAARSTMVHVRLET
ncbi:MAG TPA: nitroreductase/quinone reductase family protein [Jiangellaceae bacterium]|nr:nitroreductase/quinone reductase family protein [Jiangellaceae bacterium]